MYIHICSVTSAYETTLSNSTQLNFFGFYYCDVDAVHYNSNKKKIVIFYVFNLNRLPGMLSDVIVLGKISLDR
jgi:hypothetical protein